MSKATLKHSKKHYQSIVGIDKPSNQEPETKTTGDFFEEELKRVIDTNLSNSLREWWDYKKWKYSPIGWKKQITITLKYPSKIVCDRIDEAIASGWEGMNLSTMKVWWKQIETNTEKIMVRRQEADIYN